MKLTLKTKEVIQDGCFSELYTETGDLICLTAERTFEELGNRPKIPAGVHKCTKTFFVRGKYETFEIHVEGHSRLLFHTANIENQLDGCIATGLDYGVFSLNKDGKIAKDGEAIAGKKKGVTGSKSAFALFWAIVKDYALFDLEVTGR